MPTLIITGIIIIITIIIIIIITYCRFAVRRLRGHSSCYAPIERDELLEDSFPPTFHHPSPTYSPWTTRKRRRDEHRVNCWCTISLRTPENKKEEKKRKKREN